MPSCFPKTTEQSSVVSKYSLPKDKAIAKNGTARFRNLKALCCGFSVGSCHTVLVALSSTNGSSRTVPSAWSWTRVYCSLYQLVSVPSMGSRLVASPVTWWTSQCSMARHAWDPLRLWIFLRGEGCKQPILRLGSGTAMYQTCSVPLKTSLSWRYP